MFRDRLCFHFNTCLSFLFFFNDSCLFSLILILYLTILTVNASSSRGAVFRSVQTLTEQ